MQALSRSILFVVAAHWLCVNAIDDRTLLDTENFETMTHHEMLHSTRRLTVDDVQSMSIFAEFDRKKQSSNPKIGPSLLELLSDDALGLVTKDYYFNHGLIANLHGGSKKVLVEVVGDTIENIEDVLVQNGFKSLSCYKHMCSLYASIDDITKLERIPQVTRINAPMPSIQERSIEEGRNRRLQGSVTSQGVISHKIDKARTKYNVNGTGILICVLGISFNCRNRAANDTLSGDLPPSSRLNILNDLNSTQCASTGNVDDARQLVQIAYDVAPGARFAVSTAGSTESEIAKSIVSLADLGCDIIFDNLYNQQETWFQDSIVTQVVDDIIDKGVAYYTFPGGFLPGSAWDAPSGFVPSGISPPNSTGQFHLFGNTSSGSPIISQRVGLPNTGSNFEVVAFQWDQPSFRSSGPPGCQSDLDIILSFNGTNRISYAVPTSNIGGDAGEGGFVVPALTGSTNSTVFFDLFIIHKSGPLPKYMKIMIVSSATGRIPVYEFSTNTTTLVGKANSGKISTVCPVQLRNTPEFNVTPPTTIIGRTWSPSIPILFDRSGNRTLTPIIRKPMRFCAVVDVTIANQPFSSNANMAHVAGIAALMLQVKGGPKSLTPRQISNFMETTAIDMDDVNTPGFDVGYDAATGFGFVDALAALDAATATKAPTKAPTKRPTKAPTKRPTKAPTKFPTKSPTKLPTTAPTKTPTTAPVRPDCGLFGLNIFCPTTRCGLIGRLLRLCYYQ